MEMNAGTYCTLTNKHTHAVAATSFTGRRQKFTNTHTHAPCNKGPVCGGKMNCWHCIISMSHHSVINEKNDPKKTSPYQKRKIKTQRASSNKMMSSFAGNLLYFRRT